MKVYILQHEGDNNVSYTFSEILDVYTNYDKAIEGFIANKSLVRRIQEQLDEKNIEYNLSTNCDSMRIEWDSYFDELSLSTYYTDD